uniref:MLO-like protein n=1 Tax=Gongylonema pulchrum TaxID=637853 RepID=A0A183EVM1_9BILA
LQLGPFIATFANKTEAELEIRNGRLVAANSDIAKNGKESGYEDEKSMEDDESNDFYSQLPPSVVIPGTDTIDDEPANQSSSEMQKLERTDSDDIADSMEKCEVKEQNSMEVDNDDVEISFEGPSHMEEDDDTDAFGEITFWSPGYVDVDLSSYGKSATPRKSENDELAKAEFMHRRTGTFFETSHCVSVCVFDSVG